MKKIFSILLTALLPAAVLAQSANGPAVVNGKYVSIVAPTGTPSGVKLVAPDGNVEVYTDDTLRWDFETSDGDLVPATDGALDIGSSTKQLDNLYIESLYPDNIQTGSATALDADVTTATTATPLSALVGSSAVQTHQALIQNVASAQGAEIMALKTRAAAGSTNANTIVSSGDDILKISAYGADGADFKPAAQILMESGGTPGTADMPGKISLLVTADGAATLTEALNIASTTVATFANDVVLTSGDLSLLATGKTIEYETGTAASACMGTGTLNGTTAATISTTCATTNSKIFISKTSDGSGSAANDQVGAWATNIVNGVSFDIDSGDANDSATLNWVIFHEAP